MGRDTCAAGINAEIKIEDYLDDNGDIALPENATLTAYLDRNIADLGDTPAYRYLDFTRDDAGAAEGITWTQLGTRLRAVGGRLQQVSNPGDRVAILAPQGIEYVVGFFAAIHAGMIAVPLFAPELPGHAERLDATLADAAPSVILTTTGAAQSVRDFFGKRPAKLRPRIIAIDAVPDAVGATFAPAAPASDDIAYLQYTSGSTRTPVGVEITHRGVCTNVLQMILAGGLDTNTRSVSWLPLYHDMGLIMIMFPALCGGHITLMSPLAFVRRPHRGITQLAAEAAHGRVFAAAPNFAYELAAQRGLPADTSGLDLRNVVGLLNGSEPVSIASINAFNATFGPYGLPATTIKPSYGMAEATLSVATIAPDAAASVLHFDRAQLAIGRAEPVAPDHPAAVPYVSCGQVIPNQWAVIADSESGAELAERTVGEIWLHGDNIARGYWGRHDETELVFRNKLQSRLETDSHAAGAPDGGLWLRTGDLGTYVGGQLYVIGRIKDLIIIDGRNHHPQDIEATVSTASPAVRAGYVAAFSLSANEIPGTGATDAGERLVVIAERATGAGRTEQAPVAAAIRAAVSRHHGLPVADVQLVAAGTIPRTSSGKLARRACKSEYLAGASDQR